MSDRPAGQSETARGERDCERCEGGGSYSELAPCTTFTTDCACNGPRVLVDPCPDCGGSGVAASPSSPTGPSEDEIERAAKAIEAEDRRSSSDLYPASYKLLARAALTAAREAS